MTSSKNCCIPGCEGSKGRHEVLQKFPDPKKDKERFNAWLNAVGTEILGLDNDHIFKYRRICRAHFEEKYLCRNSRLSNHAVPTLHLNNPLLRSRKEHSNLFIELTEPSATPDNIAMTPEILRNNICRICATYHESGPKLVSLYLCDGETEPLAKTVNTLLPIKVDENDGLPTVACHPCASKLQAWRLLWDSCAETQKLLTSQAALLNAADETPTQAVADEKSQLTDMIQNILASYVVNINLMELACQVCHLKTSSEEFPQHLRANHENLKNKDDVEAFVRDHVTFEETLESDEDCESIGLVSEVPRRFDRSSCHKDFADSLQLSDHLESHRSRNSKETDQDLEKVSNLKCRGDDAADSASTTQLTASASGTPHVTVDETNQKRIPAVCPECNRTFSNKYNMLSHLRAHGGRAARLQCECGRSYSTRGNLAEHRRTAHLGDYRHRCDDCGARFASLTARDVHARLHSGARPYACAHCPRAFRAKNSLDRHLDTHAPRRFPCALCGRAFRRRGHLRSHVATHRRRPG